MLYWKRLFASFRGGLVAINAACGTLSSKDNCEGKGYS
jgi:hypothetical protein